MLPEEVAKLAQKGDATSAEANANKEDAPHTDPNTDKTKDKNKNGEGASKLDAGASSNEKKDDRYCDPEAHTAGAPSDDDSA